MSRDGPGPYPIEPIRREFDLLLCCARTSPDRHHGRITEILEVDLDWALLVRTALAHGVVPLLARSLARVPRDTVPGEIRAALDAYDRDNQARSQALLDALFEIVAALAGSGATAIPYRGPVLGAVAYGAAACRPAGDLDLLVREEQLQAISEVLRRAGYRETGGDGSHSAVDAAEMAAIRHWRCASTFVRDRDGIVVEPHWAIAPEAMAVALDCDGLRDRASNLVLCGRTVPSLALEDLLHASCIHGSVHAWTRLQWICDVAELVARHPGMDLTGCLARAREQGSERMVVLGLALARRVLGTDLPAEVLRRVDADRSARALVRDVVDRLFRADGPAPGAFRLSLFRARMRERTRDRCRYLVRTVSPPTIEQMHVVRRPPGLRFPYGMAALARAWLAPPFRRSSRWALNALEAVALPLRPGAGKRVLVIDWLPDVHEGAGFPRMNMMLRCLRGAGYRVTLYPPDPCFETDAALSAMVPRAIEVVRGRAGLDELETFLAERPRTFAAIIIARPMNMARLADLCARRPDFLTGTRLVYDSEAIFAVREIHQRRILGDPVDAATASRMVEHEAALARNVDVVLAVSRSEQDIFRRHGARRAEWVSYAVPCAPTRRPFADRRGLLFVGRIAEDGWPNSDSLVWFRDRVLPDLRRRLADLGHEVILTVAGKTGSRELADHPRSDIRYLGIVDDLAPLFDAARVFIAPTRFAAGVPIKLYDAAARGLPIVATRLLAEQLGWQAGEDLLAGEVSDAGTFADNVVALYTDPDLWSRVRAHALSRIEREASPRRFREALVNVLETPVPPS